MSETSIQLATLSFLLEVSGTHVHTPHSCFHGVGFDVPSQSRLEEKFLRERLGSILTDHKRIGSIIAERTKLDQKVVETLFTEAQTKDAAFAVSTGIVHEVKDVQIPPGSNIVSLVFQR